MSEASLYFLLMLWNFVKHGVAGIVLVVLIACLWQQFGHLRRRGI